MKPYVQQLKLSFDPFDASASNREFFEGGNRSNIRDQIVERAMYSESLISVSGCLGSGKTSLLASITQSFGEEAVVVNIVATLFMNSDQFMDQLVAALQLPGEFESNENRAHAVAHLAGQLKMDARSLLIQVDDAHELSREVLKELVGLKSSAAAESLNVILFGESQLGNMLENTLDQQQLAILAEFELDGFGSEATIDYIRFKLGIAGYAKPLPFVGSVLGSIHNSSNGMPGAINALVRDELDKEFGDAIEAAEVELGLLENQFSAEIAAEEREYTDDELVEFSAAGEVEVADPAAQERSTLGRYFVAAGILLVVLIAAIVLFRPDQELETDVARISVPVSAASTNLASGAQVIPEQVSLSTIAQRSRASSDLSPSGPEAGLETVALSMPATAEPVPVINDEREQEAVMAESTANVAAKQAEEEPAVAVSSAAAEVVLESEPEGIEPAVPLAVPSSASNAVTGTVVRFPEPVTTDSATDSVTDSAADSSRDELSGFERLLLSSPSTNYTVQIVGASSEANIQAFVKATQLSVTAGYFETRFNGKPWYVVIAGNFSDKESAAALISALPDSAKASGPWVRDLAGIQSDIRKLQ